MSIITTLDGKQWKEKDLLKRMEDDAFYYGYLGEHCLSSSAIKQMIKQGTWEYIPTEETQPLRDGKLIHLLALEPHRIKEILFAGGTKASKTFKQANDSFEMVFTLSEYKRCQAIADAVLEDLDAFELLHASQKEVPAIKMINGLPVRGKADLLNRPLFIGDLKTTKNLDDTDATIEFFGYDVQGALYRDLFDVDKFVIVWVCKTTLRVKIQWLTDEQLNNGQTKYLHALEQFHIKDI